MRLWPQSSQRSTCPPSAAERHCPIADMTWSWARLTCPALARSQSAPWRAKTYAISSFGRRTAVRLSLGSRPPVDQLCEPVKWAGYGPDRAIGDARVKRRGVQLGMTQKSLNHANIDILLEEVRGKAVPQRVRRHVLRDPRGLGGGADNAAELPGRQRPLPPLPRSTRSSMRSESISPTLSATASETRSPAPYAVANAALYFGADAACSSSVTSATLSTVGIRRGYGTTVSRRARSGRSSVTVKKKRRAETALLMLGGCMPLCVWCSWKRRSSSAVAVSGDRRMKAT